ncbi:amidohydrolase family protein [Agromyces sp. PvR057]|uniref:amidohydrolase family protein n=1 Tax=Agromyces sp. PvR057 TaxID=3156403 RepID=UPI00339215B3
MNAPRFESVLANARLPRIASFGRSSAAEESYGGQPVDLFLERGRIAAIAPAGALDRGEARTVIDSGGRAVVPSFAEPHLHLDKALLGSSAGGGLTEAIRRTSAAKAGFTAGDVRRRAERVLALALASGTTMIRAQTEVDPGVGTLSVDVLRELGEEHASWLRLQVAVFPQEGLMSRPGTLELMEQALDATSGAVVGGCPYAEADVEDARRHIDLVLDLARDRGLQADLHLDLADDDRDARFGLAEYVARGAADRGLHGRVAIGHATTLTSLTEPRLRRTLAALAEADVAVVPLPATDLFLNGRSDPRVVRRGVAPLKALWEADVRVALSSNNVRNAFTPTGLADPLDIALLQARIGHHVGDGDFARLLGAVTTDAASVMFPDEVHAVRVGARADLVVLDDVGEESPVITQPARHLVLSAGKPVYQERRDRVWHGAAAAFSDHGRAVPPDPIVGDVDLTRWKEQDHRQVARNH